MLKVHLTILAVCVAGGFSVPLDYKGQFPSNNSDTFEGDILLQPKTRLAYVDPSRHWPGATLFYTIDSSFPPYERGVIQAAMDEIERVSCVRFKQRTNEDNYVMIENIPENGCRSMIGMVGGPQALNLDTNTCFDPVTGKGFAMHELLHALGFFHQHAAHDRDDYVIVVTDNIDRVHWPDFNKQPESVASDFHFGYDLDSIMHYDQWAFAIDQDQPSIIPKNDPNAPIGQRLGLSLGDAEKLKHMYGC